MKRLIALVMIGLLLLPTSLFAGNCSVFRTWNTGDSLTASDLNASFTTAASTNSSFQCLDDYSSDATQMAVTTDPNSAGNASLATDGAGELARLRYVVQHTLGFTNWWRHYQDVNFADRALRNHLTVSTASNTRSVFSGQMTGSGTDTRFHAFALGFTNQGVHHETALMRVHVNTTTMALVLGLGGDLHLGGTLRLGSPGAASHAALFLGTHTNSGLFWPANDAVGVTIKGTEVARFHATGLHVSGTLSLGDTTIGGLTSGANRLLGYSSAGQAIESKAVVAGTGVTITHATGTMTFAVENATTFQGQVRLEHVTGTTLLLRPWNGDKLHIGGIMMTVPHAGATLTSSGTSANFAYHIYAYSLNGQVALHASAAQPNHITGGFRVNAADANHTYVGMARTNGSAQWESGPTKRFVISWFNRRTLGGVNAFTSNQATASNTYVEISASIRIEFLTWADDAVTVSAAGGANIGGAAANPSTSIGFDGATAEETVSYSPSGSVGPPFAVSISKSGLSEGYHYATLLGHTTGGASMSWLGSATVGERSALTISLRG